MDNSNRYIYGMRSRPAMYGTCPPGFAEIENQDYPYGCVAYDAPLSPQDIYRYELIPHSPNTYPVAVGDVVVVNEVDDATVIGFEPRGFVRVRYHFDGSTEDSVIWGNVKRASAPCQDCHGGGQLGRMTQDGTTMYLVTCDKCGGSGRVVQDAASRDHSMDSYRERLTAQYAEHAQPAVNRADPAESRLAAYAEFMQGHAQESEARALAAEAALTETRQALDEQRERADAAEWSENELRNALADLLESGCVNYVNPRNEDVSCAVCGAVSRHPFRHRAGCAVQAAEDALRDTDGAGKWVAKSARYEALVEAAGDLMQLIEQSGAGYENIVPGGYPLDMMGAEALMNLRDALTALEGESDE